MKKSSKFLLVILVLILGLGLLSWWHYRQFEKALSGTGPPKIDFSEFDFGIETEPQETETFQELLVPDGDFKMTHSISWQNIDQQSGFNLETLNTENAKTIFYATKIMIKEVKMAWLIVQQLDFGEERGLEEIIEKIKSAGESLKIETEIQNLEIEENSAQFKITQRQSGYSITGEEKIILTENSIYSILVFSLTPDWNLFQEEAGQILSSAQALPAE